MKCSKCGQWPCLCDRTYDATKVTVGVSLVTGDDVMFIEPTERQRVLRRVVFGPRLSAGEIASHP